MENRAMERKLDTGDALDVNVIGNKHAGFAGVWRIEKYLEGMDYCDAEGEQWIWSIGKHKQTGEIFAATDNRFYQNPLFECLWLR